MRDLDKPLFNRAIQATYPPGSTFKPTQGLILLEEGIITTGTMFPCYHGFISGGLRVGCHGHGSPLPLKPALQTSCNAYFCWGFKAMVDKRSKYGTSANAFDIWKKHMVSMGYGYKLGVDLPANTADSYPTSISTTNGMATAIGAPTPSYPSPSVRARSSPPLCR